MQFAVYRAADSKKLQQALLAVPAGGEVIAAVGGWQVILALVNDYHAKPNAVRIRKVLKHRVLELPTCHIRLIEGIPSLDKVAIDSREVAVPTA